MTTIGLHGVKLRWVPDTVRDGLCRPSAAWFMAPAQVWPGVAVATAAAAVYLALGDATRRLLCPPGQPASYARIFHDRPELLPSLMVFRDSPTGRETTHRYAWLGGPRVTVTAAYTKVARAGRTTAVPAGPVHVVSLSTSNAARLEAELVGGDGPYWWDNRRLIERVDRDAEPGSVATPPGRTRIGAFCQAAARLLLAQLAHAGILGTNSGG